MYAKCEWTCAGALSPQGDAQALRVHPDLRDEVQTKQGVQQSDLVELIHSFFAGRHDWILRKLAAA